jgi:hypothetical protein
VLYLALVPSNQDRNKYAQGGINEHINMHLIAKRIEDIAANRRGLTCKAFPANPESRDGYHLEGLIRVLSDATRWLRTAGAGVANSLIINMHSDSGDYSHLGYYYGDAEGARAGRTIIDVLARQFNVSKINHGNYGAYAFYTKRAGYNSILLELFSHVHGPDLEFLLNHHRGIAQCIIDGVLEYLPDTAGGTPPSPELDDFQKYFSLHGVPCYPDAAIYKYWRAAVQAGYNPGPALRPEEPGETYQEPGNIVQFFENRIIVCKPDEGFKCYEAQVVMNPKRWFP